MRCSRCQHESPPSAKFCAECGASLARDCTRCGLRLPEGAKFCPECAQPVAAPTLAPEGRYASPAEYTPKHIAEKILSSKGALEGERKQVTVLFADLKGSLELLADRDPEEARRLLDPVLARMIEAVHRYEGTVNQVMGDGIMALFGAPLAHEDHALRACYAALGMQAALRRLVDELRQTCGVEARIRIGLNSGEVVVRAIGSDLHMDYTAVGQTTHLAARMEQLATPGTIWLTADTLRLVEGFVDFKSLGPIRVKGLAEPVEAFQLVGAGPIRSRLQAAAARGLTPLVGRQMELQTLATAAERAAGGRGQIVGVVGEPGVGKSRLYWEFMHLESMATWKVLSCGSVSYGKATAWLPLINLLRAYFGLDELDAGEGVRERVSARLGEAFRQAGPAILTLLEAPVEDETWRKLDPTQRRQRTLDAVRGLLLRESKSQPLLLLVEDLHWIDSETQALLDSLVDSLPTARLLLLVNYRPEYQHAWGGKTSYTQIRLDPLPAPSAETLLLTLLGEKTAFPPLMRLLIERTEGNPFFLEESVRALIETGVIVGQRGAYHLARPVASIQIPATVQAVLAARIDRLAPDEKHLLQSAAVIGKDVPLLILESIVDEPDEALRRRLARLQAAEFLYETSLFPELEYTFKHALTLEVAYESVLRERRRALHTRVVDALERLYPHRLGEKVELLAHHAMRGEAWERAARYLYQAGEKALAQGRPRAAAGSFQATVDALDTLREGADQTLKLDALLELWVTKISTSQLEGLPEVGEKAEALARALNDGPRLARVQVRQAQAQALMGLVPGTLESAIERAREAFLRADPKDLRTRSYAQFIAGVSCRDLGRFRDAVAEFGRGTALFPPLRESGEETGLIFPIYVSLRGWCSEAHVALGEFDTALASAAEALRVAGEIHHPPSTAIASAFLGYCRLIRGDIDGAVPVLQRGLAIAQEHESPHGITANALYLAYALMLLGRHEPGLETLTRAMEKQIAFMPQWTRYGTLPAAAYLLAGRVDDAAREADQGLALVAERQARGYRAPLLRVQAEVRMRREAPDVEGAAHRLAEALALATELEMRPEIARCRESLARLHRRIGDRAVAAEHLDAAVRLFRAMGAAYWADRAEAEGNGPR
jgi:class 3 adenylate cyclase/tetratricopeptide (TPR) repeat protein